MTAPAHLENILSDRKSLGTQTIYALKDAMAEEPKQWRPRWERDTIRAFYTRLSLCNSDHNQFAAEDMNELDDEELYDGTGRFWYCNSKLCPECVKRSSRRNRRAAEKALKNTRLLTFENFQFITLTMPHDQLPLKQSRRIINYAWSLLRKRTIFLKITGGIKSEEFTFTKNGYHYHLHLLVKAKFFRYDALRTEWTECLIKAFEKEDIDVEFHTRDNKAIIRCIKIPPTQKALKKMCFELTKYITKSDSWSKIPSEDLIDVALTERFPRMFELFGSMRAERDKTIVHNPCVSDGTIEDENPNLPSWRERIYFDGYEAYTSQLFVEYQRTKSIRIDQLEKRFSFATFHYDSDFSESVDNWL